jgi:hypothetical protein
MQATPANAARRNAMKKGIVPVCLACVMLISMCRRETGGDGAIDQEKGFEYGKNSYTQAQSSGYREGATAHGTGIKRAMNRPAITERTAAEDNTGGAAAEGSKRTGKARRETADASNRGKSERKVQDRSAGMTGKEAGGNGISVPASESEKGDPVPSDTGREPKPGGLLVKPRVDVPEVK